MLATDLTQLESSGLIRLAQRNPDLEYLFRHALLQEAAYDSILKADRKLLHLAVAEEMEQLHHDRLDESSALLGFHFREAGKKDKAREYFSRAANYAAAKFANHEAELNLRAALELSPGEQEQASLVLRLGTALMMVGHLEEARGFFQQALPIYIKYKDFDNVAGIYGMFAQVLWGFNDVAGILEITQEGLRVVGDQPAGKGMADLLRWAAAGCVFNDRLDEGTVLVYKALDVSRKAKVHHALAHSLATLGVIQDQLGQPEQAVASYKQAIVIAEKYSLSNPNARARNNLASLLVTMGRLSEAAEHYEYMVALCQKENNIFFKIWFLAQLGLVYLDLGKTRQAFELLEQLDIDQKAVGGNTYREQYDEFLGMTCYYTGGVSQAKEVLTKLHETTNNRQTILSTAVEKAAILQAQGSYPEAVALIEKAIRESGTWSGAEQWFLLAAARALAGDAPGARKDLAHADDMIDAQPNFLETIERLKAEINLDLLETHYSAAMEKYRELAEHYRAAEYRWRYAQTLRDWANVCIKANRFDAARDFLEQVAMEFDAMEILIYADQIRQQLAEIHSPNP
jgi:tetratricopeptide (TPR) repeat protein